MSAEKGTVILDANGLAAVFAIFGAYRAATPLMSAEAAIAHAASAYLDALDVLDKPIGAAVKGARHDVRIRRDGDSVVIERA